MIVGGERAKRESRVTGGSGMALDILDNLVSRASLSLDLSEVRALTPPGSGEAHSVKRNRLWKSLREERVCWVQICGSVSSRLATSIGSKVYSLN